MGVSDLEVLILRDNDEKKKAVVGYCLRETFQMMVLLLFPSSGIIDVHVTNALVSTLS